MMYRSILFSIYLLCIFVLTISENTKGSCNCAVMKKNDSNPILEHALQFIVNCDLEGEASCKKLCLALADGARERAPILICKSLNQTVIDLQLELYSRTCNEAKWMPSNLEDIEPLCCEEGKPTKC